MRCLAIDPGGHNGISLWDYDLQGNYEMILADAVEKHELFKYLETMDLDLIVYEGFRLYASKAQTMINSEFETPQIIGVIKYIAYKRGIPQEIQMATCKKFFDDDRIKKMGFNPPTMHAKDSIRHFLYFYYFVGSYGDKRRLL